MLSNDLLASSRSPKIAMAYSKITLHLLALLVALAGPESRACPINSDGDNALIPPWQWSLPSFESCHQPPKDQIAVDNPSLFAAPMLPTAPPGKRNASPPKKRGGTPPPKRAGLNPDDQPSTHLEPQQQGTPIGDHLQELQTELEKLMVADTDHQGTNNHQHHPLPTDRVTLTPLKIDLTGAGLYCDRSNGARYYLKPRSNRDAARHEVLMAQLARASGLAVPNTGLLEDASKIWIVSRWQPNLKTGIEALQTVDKLQLARLFITAVWLGNGNIIGYHFNHTGVDSQQRVHGLNWSGAGYYRTDGTRKCPDSDNRGGFLDTVFELKDLCDASTNFATAQVFATLTEADIAAVVPLFLRQAYRPIKKLVNKYGPTEALERRYLKITLYERLNDLAMRYPNHLPRVTGAELAVIPLHGLSGVELAVRSRHIWDQVLTIGCGFDQQEQPFTQLSLRLTAEKTAEFADKLELGSSYHDLRARLIYFLGGHMANKVMTEALHKDLWETYKQVVELQQKLQDLLAGTTDIPVLWREGRVDWPQKIMAVIQELNAQAHTLNKLAVTPTGTKLQNHGLLPARGGVLPSFAPRRVRSDWTCSRPAYQIVHHRPDQQREEPDAPVYQQQPGADAPFIGDAFLYRVQLSPGGGPRNGFPTPAIPMEMEFHGPDANAYALEGQVRLKVSAAPNKKTVQQLLAWLADNGLDIQRPDYEAMQRHYHQKLEQRMGASPIPMEWSSASTENLPWKDYTRRDGGRIVMMLPEDDRLLLNRRQRIRPVHELFYGRKESARTPLESLVNGGLRLQSFRNRVNQGQPGDAISFPPNICNNGANLVFTHLQPQDSAYDKAQLVFKSALLNRLDALVSRNYGGQSQPWFIRHERIPLDTSVDQQNLLQCNISASISLPEWLESINVKTLAEQCQVHQMLKQSGLLHWPGGTPVTKLVRAIQSSHQHLYQQYFACMTRPTTAFWIKQVIGSVGVEQFLQLLMVNPELPQGKLVSLAGIRLKDTAINGVDLAALNLHNCTLDRVMFIDCRVVGANLGQCDLRNVQWHFSQPEQYQADIAYLANYLESAFAASGDICWLKQLLSLHKGSGGLPQLLPLLEKYRDHLE